MQSMLHQQEQLAQILQPGLRAWLQDCSESASVPTCASLPSLSRLNAKHLLHVDSDGGGKLGTIGLVGSIGELQGQVVLALHKGMAI